MAPESRPMPHEKQTRVNFYINDQIWSRDMIHPSRVINKKKWGRTICLPDNETMLIRYNIISITDHIDGSLDVYMVEASRHLLT